MGNGGSCREYEAQDRGKWLTRFFISIDGRAERVRVCHHDQERERGRDRVADQRPARVCVCVFVCRCRVHNSQCECCMYLFTCASILASRAGEGAGPKKGKSCGDSSTAAGVPCLACFHGCVDVRPLFGDTVYVGGAMLAHR